MTATTAQRTGPRADQTTGPAWRVACKSRNVRYGGPRWSADYHRLDPVRPKR
jgi:hypothetical protein